MNRPVNTPFTVRKNKYLYLKINYRVQDTLKLNEKEISLLKSACCFVCDDEFTRLPETLSHLRSEHGIFNCSLCLRLYTSQPTFEHHVLETHIVFFCTKCPFVGRLDNFETHKRSSCVPDNTRIMFYKTTSLMTQQPSAGPQPDCTLCPYTAPNVKVMEDHCTKVHGMGMIELFSTKLIKIPPNSFKSIVKAVDMKRLTGQLSALQLTVCGFCRLPCDKISKLEEHLQRRHEHFPCKLCSFSATSKVLLEDHVGKFHTDGQDSIRRLEAPIRMATPDPPSGSGRSWKPVNGLNDCPSSSSSSVAEYGQARKAFKNSASVIGMASKASSEHSAPKSLSNGNGRGNCLPFNLANELYNCPTTSNSAPDCGKAQYAHDDSASVDGIVSEVRSEYPAPLSIASTSSSVDEYVKAQFALRDCASVGDIVSKVKNEFPPPTAPRSISGLPDPPNPSVGKKNKKNKDNAAECHLCSFSGMRPVAFIDHYRVRHEAPLFKEPYQQPLTCRKCPYKSTSHISYYKHLETTHQLHCCSMCETEFSNPKDLVDHVKIACNPFIHDVFKACDVCFTLGDPALFVDHLCSEHLKDTAIPKCHICGFAIKDNLNGSARIKFNDHLLTAHGVYACNVCHEAYDTLERLVQHINLFTLL